MQTRDKRSPVPCFRRRETVTAAKARVPLLHLSLATRECGGNRRKESREQTLLVATQCPFPPSLPPPLPFPPVATVNSVNICLSCLTIRLLRPFRFLRGFLLFVVLVSAKYRELADASTSLRNICEREDARMPSKDTQIFGYLHGMYLI